MAEDSKPTPRKEDPKEGEKKDEATTTTPTAEAIEIRSPSPTLSVSLLVFWVLPVLILACCSHFAFDKDKSFHLNIPEERRTTIDLTGGNGNNNNKNKMKKKSPSASPSLTPSSGGNMRMMKARSTPQPSPLPSGQSNWPTSYRQTINTIQKRDRKVPRIGTTSKMTTTPSSSSSSSTSANKPAKRDPKKNDHKKKSPSTPSRDPQRQQYEDKIDELRENYQADPEDVLLAIRLADALRLYDITYHDGGTKQPEALETYDRAIDMSVVKRNRMLEAGDETTLSLTGTRNVRNEVTLDYSQKSMDGLLCAMYTAKGKVYFMANMFERAVEAYASCLELEPLYLDALGSRGSSLIILGRYEEAGNDLMTTIENDEQNYFNDAYTGLARILQAKESYIPQGWDTITSRLDELIPSLEGMISSLQHEEQKKMIANTLNRLHHVMFTYHDVKTKDTSEAWDHLSRSFKFKMSALAPWQSGFEQQKIAQTMQIFHKGFWPPEVGSPSSVPVFIVGFVRSGSTLLERVLDAHPDVVGTGEDSVFNGRLDKIRNEIVEASILGDPAALAATVERQADNVVAEMKERWENIDANTATEAEARPEPQRFVDKMLNNYYNIGFIHMLFPKALILHVIREPMDTIFSAYKHEFPPGTLDYTSDFSSLAELYHSYRDLMDHWDKELPGRVTHVRYEDLVHDMPGMAKSIIEATGLDWHDDVLQFHKKKHAVNTLSTTQVRQGIYKHSLQSWRKYEEELQPLVELIGERVDPKRETSLPGYVKPAVLEKESAEL